METYGKYLEEIRKKKKITLDKISETTKIKKDYLKAIEDEHISDIVGPAYAKLIILNYARYVGADQNKALNLFDLHNQSKVELKTALSKTSKKKPYEKKILISKTVLQILGLIIFIVAIFTIGLHLYKQGKLQRNLLSNGTVSYSKKSSQPTSESKKNQKKIQNIKAKQKNKVLNPNNSWNKYKKEDLYKEYILRGTKSPWYVVPRYIKSRGIAFDMK